MSDLQFIKINQLHHHPDNPRKDLGDVTELAESIKAKGVLQNLTVVPWSSAFRDDECPEALAHAREYAVVIGNRRLEAGILAGVEELPCIVSDMRYQEQISTMMVENVQRADLTIYEQAQGFQMMLDLGDTVDAISEKTGFSKKTVKGRLEIAKLDPKTLEKVSAERQLSLGDFEKLTQLEDIKDRNRCLEAIGTFNFDRTLTECIQDQNRRKYLPKVKAWLKSVDAKEIKREDRWSNKYDGIGPYISVGNWPDEKDKLPKDEKRPLFYYIDSYGSLQLFVKHERAKPEKKSKAELEKEKRMAEAHEKAAHLTKLAFELRSNFVKGMTATQKNMQEMLLGAVLAGALANISYTRVMSKDLLKAAGWSGEDTHLISQNTENFVTALKESGTKHIPAIIYTMFGDEKDKGYHTVYKYDFPRYQEDKVLDALYSWLCSLGYEMSDDEKAMQDGTHEVFQQGKEEKA